MSGKKSKTKFLIDAKHEERVKDSFYDDYYKRISDYAIQWRKFASEEKCKSILQLCKGLKFDKVVDIGAGFCSVLSKLDELKFAPELYAFEVSPSVIRFIKERINIPRLKAVYLLNTSKTNFDNDFFDFGILSHVLEHVTNPEELLSEALRICKYVVVEVPLEDCLFANIYSGYVEKVTGHKRSDNPIGHINFFNKSTIRKLVKTSGGIISKERTYRSWKIYPNEFRMTTIFQLFRSIIFHFIFKITNSRLVVTHNAILITARSD